VERRRQRQMCIRDSSTAEQSAIISRNKKSTMRFLIKNCLNLGLVKSFQFKRMNGLNFSDAF
jgi:hypothetical protein